MKRYVFVFFLLLWPFSVYAADITLMVIDQNSYPARLAVQELGTGLDVEVVSASDLKDGGEALKGRIEQSRVIVVDVMGHELEEYLLDNISLPGKIVYALRGSTDDERLKKRGFIFDAQVAAYYRPVSKRNIVNMLRFVANRHLGTKFTCLAPIPEIGKGIYHPDAPNIFTSFADYQKWQATRKGYNPDAPMVGIIFYSSSLTPGQKKPIMALIKRLESEHLTVLACFGNDQEVIEKFLLDSRRRPRIDMLVALSLKFSSALSPALAEDLVRLDVPIFNAISLYQDTIDEWRQSPVGIGGSEVAWSIATPEISGLIEPTPISAKRKMTAPKTGKSFFIKEAINENIDLIMVRIHQWLRLQQLDNSRKKVAIMFYNHHQGKQNIGASYLNVFASLQQIIHAMREDGYQTGASFTLGQEDIKKLIMTSARNIGSWAPGELDRLLRSAQVIRLPIRRYKKWFARLPLEFQRKMLAQWGPPEKTKIMRVGDDFIIPAVTIGNLVLLPEPARGWSDEPMKLTHDNTLYPHHQYLAVYLWLNHGFKADAMIHLGTHATYEWTPGKQAGLSPSCSPEVLIGGIPNIYPYIVDDVGEGIQAKRRGRGVIISHLTPMLKESGLYAEYARMSELINEYKRAVARKSSTASGKLKELMALVGRTGIMADLAAEKTALHHDGEHTNPEEEIIHPLIHYLDDIKMTLIPYGLHTFGKSPQGRELSDTVAAIQQWQPDAKREDIRDRLRRSGSSEMTALLAALNGRFVRPGEGNDPVRNPASLPTGRNFYGFNPQRLPTPAAWKLGKRAAEDIIANYRLSHNRYPHKVAIVLWATETLRNEGVNESTILYLMGIKPRWAANGRVTGLTVISGQQLKRPRIDVMINASGLYRDLFPDKLKFIDDAVQMAIRQTDIDNMLRQNSAHIRQHLLAAGVAPEEAEELSRLRVFSEQPGAYGTGVAEMAASSGIWESEKQVAKVYENRMGFVFGRDHWGKAAGHLLQENLAGVEIAVHSRSSNIYGLMDNDDMFQYLGGLAMAVRLESGNTPETVITRQQKPGQVTVEDLAKNLGRELRSRYLNPKWIEAMKREDYAGAREMAHFADYLWGWDMTTPDKVDDGVWRQVYQVYVEDKYHLNLKEFFDRASPWAYQSMTGRMLETIRKGYWRANEATKRKLAVEYAVNVVHKGVACCDHTCNNPMLNQMVVSIISLPGVMSPELVEKFKIAIKKMAAASLAEQVVRRRDLLKKLNPSDKQDVGRQEQAPKDTSATAQAKDAGIEVEGYKMEKIKSDDTATEMTSSGVQWLASLLVLFIIVIAAYGMYKGSHES